MTTESRFRLSGQTVTFGGVMGIVLACVSFGLLAIWRFDLAAIALVVTLLITALNWWLETRK